MMLKTVQASRTSTSRDMSKRNSLYSGFLNVHKTPGITSQQALAPLKHLLHTSRVGHGGTLDPFASGVLPVAVGRTTRLLDRVHLYSKTYVARIQLGIATTTGDPDGEIAAKMQVPALTHEAVQRVLMSYAGEVEQVPPLYSALRINGRRAYDLARRGETLQLTSRKVRIYSLSLIALNENSIEIEVTCSAGTYVRSLGADIAASLGTAGHLSQLVRTASGPFTLDNSRTVEEIENTIRTSGVEAVLLSPDIVLQDVPRITVEQTILDRFLKGATIRSVESPDGPVRVYASDGSLIALARHTESGLEPHLLLK